MTRTRLIAAAIALTLGQTWVSAQAPAFEVASIRENPGPWHVMHGYSSSGPRLTLEAWAPADLIMEAYDLKRYQVASAPPVTDFYYDVAAKAEGDGTPTKAGIRLMLQTLLANRFNLKFHRETRELPVYAMVIGKSGVKFKESPPEKPFKSYGGVNGRNQYMEISQATMEMLADRLGSDGIDRPVIDKTGLTGKYEIRLEATPEFRINNNPQPDDLRIFDAIQQQLGLKLEPQKAGIEVLVVDHMDKPSAN
jgi:uncharacterized protein (TIGR03435 family)